LRRWYLDQCDAMGQPWYGRRPCVYGRYDDQTPVSPAERLLYRTRLDLQAAFLDPYATAEPAHSYRHWYQAEVEAPAAAAEREPGLQAVQRQLAGVRAELDALRASRAWRVARVLAWGWRTLMHPLARGGSVNPAAQGAVLG